MLSTAAAPMSVRRRPAAARLVPTSTGCSRGAEACRFGHVTRAARCLLACELVCVCVSLVRVVIICPASTHTALVSSPSLTVLHLT